MEDFDFEPRKKHDFQYLEVGDKPIKSDPSLQSYVHAYGSNSGKKFATKTVNGVMYVKRVK